MLRSGKIVLPDNPLLKKMLLEDKLTKICSIIEDDGFGPITTDGECALVCSAYSKVGIRRIFNLTNRLDTFPVLLFSDLAMFKSHASRLHPRIETLLVYHSRSIKVFIDHTKQLPNIISEQGTYFRIVKDPMTKSIIKDLGHPLFSQLIINGSLPLGIEELSNEIIDKSDFIFAYNNRKLEKQPGILKIKFDDEGQIIMLE